MAFINTRSTPRVIWIALIGTVGLLIGASAAIHWLLLAAIAVVPPVLARTVCRTTPVALPVRVPEACR